MSKKKALIGTLSVSAACIGIYRLCFPDVSFLKTKLETEYCAALQERRKKYEAYWDGIGSDDIQQLESFIIAQGANDCLYKPSDFFLSCLGASAHSKKECVLSQKELTYKSSRVEQEVIRQFKETKNIHMSWNGRFARNLREQAGSQALSALHSYPVITEKALYIKQAIGLCHGGTVLLYMLALMFKNMSEPGIYCDKVILAATPVGNEQNTLANSLELQSTTKRIIMLWNPDDVIQKLDPFTGKVFNKKAAQKLARITNKNIFNIKVQGMHEYLLAHSTPYQKAFKKKKHISIHNQFGYLITCKAAREIIEDAIERKWKKAEYGSDFCLHLRNYREFSSVIDGTMEN